MLFFVICRKDLMKLSLGLLDVDVVIVIVFLMY